MAAREQTRTDIKVPRFERQAKVAVSQHRMGYAIRPGDRGDKRIHERKPVA